MSIKVQIPSALRRHTDGVGQLDCSATNLNDLFTALDEKLWDEYASLFTASPDRYGAF